MIIIAETHRAQHIKYLTVGGEIFKVSGYCESENGQPLTKNGVILRSRHFLTPFFLNYKGKFS